MVNVKISLNFPEGISFRDLQIIPTFKVQPEGEFKNLKSMFNLLRDYLNFLASEDFSGYINIEVDPNCLTFIKIINNWKKRLVKNNPYLKIGINNIV